jgi:hypothetical protein
MDTDRRTILSLIATGRITAAEAELLLAVSNERSETMLALVACLAAMFLLQGHRHDLVSDLLNSMKNLLPGIVASAQQMQNVVTHLWGGLL